MKRIWVDRDKCLGCKTCELQCAVDRGSVAKTLRGACAEMPLPLARVGVFGPTGNAFPIQCRHCQDAPCIRTCPAGAMHRDEESGLVIADQDICRGCWMCVMACPFGAIIPAAAAKVAVKCDACQDMEQPACVAACPTGALVYGDDTAYNQVLAERRGRAAMFARAAAGSEANQVVCLEYAQEGDKQ